MTEPTRPDARTQAFNVLTQAVRESTRPGHVPRASQVRLTMKRLTYDGFDPTALGFGRFRDFLVAAQSAGIVSLRDRPGDIEVLLANHEEPTPETGHTRVRRAIWRA